MIATIVWPLVFVVVGILIYALASSPKVAEIGKWIFIVGFFFLAAMLSSASVHLPR